MPTFFKHNNSFIATVGLWECGGYGHCLNRPDDPNKTCHCPDENSADVALDCKQGKTCLNSYYGDCGNGYCLNRPDNPNKTCHCPYEIFFDAPVVCEQGKTCYVYGQDYEGCGNGYCLNRSPDNPNKAEFIVSNKTCYCPYVPPAPKPTICKQGQKCEKYVLQQLLYNTYWITFKNVFSSQGMLKFVGMGNALGTDGHSKYFGHLGE